MRGTSNTLRNITVSTLQLIMYNVTLSYLKIFKVLGKKIHLFKTVF